MTQALGGVLKMVMILHVSIIYPCSLLRLLQPLQNNAHCWPAPCLLTPEEGKRNHPFHRYLRSDKVKALFSFDLKEFPASVYNKGSHDKKSTHANEECGSLEKNQKTFTEEKKSLKVGKPELWIQERKTFQMISLEAYLLHLPTL